jgi:hypothetical protein
MSGQTGVFAWEPSSAPPPQTAIVMTECSRDGSNEPGPCCGKPSTAAQGHCTSQFITQFGWIKRPYGFSGIFCPRVTTAGAGFVSKGLDEDVVTGWARLLGFPPGPPFAFHQRNLPIAHHEAADTSHDRYFEATHTKGGPGGLIQPNCVIN